jgi:hypothetical protein
VVSVARAGWDAIIFVRISRTIPRNSSILFSLLKRRDVMHQIQRHLARQQYYIHVPSGTYVAVWDPALRNYGPKLGTTTGGG